MRKAAFIFFMLFSAQLYALDINKFYIKDGAGNFNFGVFGIFNVDYEEGKIIMPLQRDEYKNISVLNKDFVNKMAECFTYCEKAAQPLTPKVKITDIRPAGAIYITEVKFDEDLLVTFLLINTKNSVRIIRPNDFVFNDKKFEIYLKDAIKLEFKRLYDSEK